MAKKTERGNRSFDPADAVTCINPDLDGEKNIFRQSGDFEIRNGKKTVFLRSELTEKGAHKK